MAKTDSQNETNIKRLEKPLAKLNGLFNDMVDKIAYNTYKSDNTRDKEIKKLSFDMDDVIFKEIKSLTSFTGDDISTFLVKLFNEYDTQNIQNVKNIEDIFSKDDQGIFQFFQERYKNLNLLYDDLSTVCSQLYELQEAIQSTRDGIVTADDISQSVSRTLQFKNMNNDEINQRSYISIIENLEVRNKLLSKLKNHIIPKTLQYGKYYAYTIPYSKLFERYYVNKVNTLKPTTESVDDNFIKEFKQTSQIGNCSGNMKNAFNDILESFEVYNNECSIPVVEGVELTELLNDQNFKKNVEDSIKAAEKTSTKGKFQIYNDGTITQTDTKIPDFSNIKDCYIKLIDPRKLIPVEILNKKIGYYYIHESDFATHKSPFSTQIKMNQTGSGNAADIEHVFLSKITDKIVKAFDKKFLEDNSKFKELILNSLEYNDIYKKQLKFQFIPIDYITEFTVNEDENGNGTSVLLPALFYAKLYLALLIFKMISIITKSNDTKIYYVKNSGIDTNVINKTQEIARSVKERSINFTDLLNYNSMVSKIGANKEIFMPVGRSGEHGIEFDVLAGQDIQLNTDLMDMLRTGFISATGVPSVIMNYVNEADYAKSIVMGSTKHAARVVNHQLDFNVSTTDWYKKIIRFSTDIPDEVVESFSFTFAPPKSLNNVNMNDLVTNADQTLQFMIKTMIGENGNLTDDDNALKDILYKRLAKDMLPMLPWEQALKQFEEAKIELAQKKASAPADNTEGA